MSARTALLPLLVAAVLAFVGCAKKPDDPAPATPDPSGTQKPGSSGAEDANAKAEALKQKGFKVSDILNEYHVTVPSKLPADAVKEISGFSTLNAITIYGANQPVTDDGIQALKGLDQLRYLDLSLCPNITDAAFTNIDRFPALEDVNLSNTKVGDATAAELAKLKHLRELNLGSTKLTDRGLASVVRIPTLTKLKIGRTGVTEAGIKSLNGLRELTVLEVDRLPLTDAGLDGLDLPKLTRLALESTSVTDAAVAKLTRFKELELVRMNDCDVTDKGILALRECPKLSTLFLSRTKVTKAAVEVLTKDKPGLNVSGVE